MEKYPEPTPLQDMVIRTSAVNELSFPEGPSESLLKRMAIKKAIVVRNISPHFASER
jgi:hypothetical protein